MELMTGFSHHQLHDLFLRALLLLLALPALLVCHSGQTLLHSCLLLYSSCRTMAALYSLQLGQQGFGLC